MKWASSSAIVVLVASSAMAWGAGQSLKSTMKAWKMAAQITSQMTNGGAPFDEVKARGAIEAFVADSQTIGDRLSPTTPASKDIKLRFARFNVDSAAALASLGNRDSFDRVYAKVIFQCKSCHDQYAK